MGWQRLVHGLGAGPGLGTENKAVVEGDDQGVQVMP